MTRYRIQAPDGNTYEIEGPEGATQAQVAQAVLAQNPSAGVPAQGPAPTKAADLGYSALSGLGGLMAFPGQLYGLATGDMDNAATRAGQAVQDYATAHQSKGLQQRREAQSEAIKAAAKDGFLSEAGTAVSSTLTDPALLGNFLAENVVNMLPGLGAARGVMGVGLRQVSKELAERGVEGAARDAAMAAARETLEKRATSAAVGTAVAQQGADVGADAYTQVYKAAKAKGMSDEEAAATALSQARAAGASGAVISYLTTRLPGARTLEEAFAGKAGAPGRLIGIGKGVLGEGVQESLEEGGGQIAKNAAVAAVDPTQDIMQGVGQTMGQAGLLGGIMGGAGGYHSAGIGAEHAAQKAAAEAQARAQELQQQQAQEEQARQAKYQDPEYAAQVAQEYQAAEAQKQQLMAAAKVGKDASMVDKLQAEQAQAKLKAFENDVLRPKAEEYLKVKPVLDSLAQQQQTEAPQAAPAPGTDLFGQPIQEQVAPAAIPTAQDVVAQHAQYQRQISGLEDALEQQRHNVAVAAQTGETDIAVAEARKFRQIEQALMQAKKEAAALPPAPKAAPVDDALNKQYQTTLKKLQQAGEIGDVDAIERLSKKLGELRQQNPGLFTKEHEAAIKADEGQLAAEMATGRETEAQRRARVEQEVAGIRQLGQKEPSYAQQARQERQTQLEVEGMERMALPQQATEQRTLFPESAAGFKAKQETMQAKRDALVSQLQAALRKRKDDPQTYRPVVDKLLEDLRALKEAPKEVPPARGEYTAEMAPELAGTRMPQVLPESQSVDGVERTLTPARTSTAALQDAIARAPQQNPLVQKIKDRLQMLTSADEGRAAEDTAKYLHQLRIGQDTTDSASLVQEHLDRLTKGTIFNTPEEFAKFLASDALNDSRKAVGLALQTTARIHKLVEPLKIKARELRESVASLASMLAATKRVGAERIEAAQAAHAKAVERIKAQEQAVDAKLQPLQAAYIKAQLELSKASDTLAKVLNSIAKNTAKFNGDTDLQMLAAKTAEAQEAHAAMLRRASNGAQVSAAEAAKLHTAVVTAINEQRAGLEQYLKTGNKLQERNILAFLNRDMEFTLRLRDAEQAVERANEGLNNARQQLEAADKEIRNSDEYLAEQRVNKRAEAHARGVLTKARDTAQRNISRTAAELAARSDERQALDKEIADLLRPIEEKQQVADIARTKEAQDAREARDAQQRKEEQAQRERLQALPGTAVSFEGMRKAMDLVERMPERIRALDEKAKDAEATPAMRNKAKYEARAAREEAKLAFALLSRDGALNNAAREELASRIDDLNQKIGNKQKAVLEAGVPKTTIASRRKELSELRSARKELLRLQGLTEARATKKEILTPEQRAAEAEDRANQLTLERGINAETVGTQGALPLRRVGPLVKPTIGVGRVSQAGERRGVSGTKALQQAKKDTAAEQAMLELSHVEDLQEKVHIALEAAQEAGDQAGITKYTDFLERLEKRHAVAEAALEKTSRTARAITNEDVDVSRLRGTIGSNDTALPVKTLTALHNGNAQGAVEQVAISSTNPVARRVAAKIAPMMGDVQSHLVDTMPGAVPDAPGGVSADGRTVFLNRETGLSEESLMHEAVHTVTVENLTKPESQLTLDQRAAKRELGAMHEALKNTPGFNNTVIRDGDVAEFVAEGHASRPVQELMAKTEWAGPPGIKTMLKNFWRNVLRMAGVPTPPNGPMLDKFLALSEKFMQAPTAAPAKGETSPARLRSTAQPEAPTSAKDVVDRIVAKDKSWWDKLRGNLSGLAFETQMVDRFAGFERLSRVMEPLKGSQMMYYLRMYDQRQHFLSVAAANGVPQRVEKTRADGRKEFIIESVKGANLKDIASTLAKAPIKDKDYVTRLFTGYMAAIRAKSKGIETLNFGGNVTQDDLDMIAKEVQATPGLKEVFEDARSQYNEYNRNLINLLVQSGAISKDVGASLVKEDDYIPYYRERNGVAELLIGSESPIRVGNIKEQPYLQELVGGDRPILDFTTSALQNTSMILNMALNNIATKNAAYSLQDMGMATIGRGHDVKGNTIVKFYDNGEEKFARVDTPDSIPADLLVKGMAGIPTQLSGVVRMMAMPAHLLRKAVTISPIYAARQVFRDSLGAAMGTGANIVPVWSAVKEINSKNKDILNNRGITGGQVFTGTSEDMSMVLRDITAGKPGWMNALGKLEAGSMGADALTRRAQYNSYIKQGLSEMEATLQSLESMNFSKRGASPSIHMANAMIPFLNAQIQSLNVLYKSFTGNMPNNDRLNIKNKLLTRGMLLAAASFAYAAAMDDDEAYKNALPEQKYGNWFVRVPGFAEPVRVPVPFELGYIFKSVPEALYRSMTDKHGGDEAVKAFGSILRNTVPGGSSFMLPQAIKPLIEVGTGKSLFTGRDILSRQEQGMEKPYQFRDSTTELAKAVGALTGQSPIMIEQLINGYTGGMGMFALAAVDSLMPTSDSPEKAARRLSQRPMIGGIFQPNDAGGIVNDTYEKMAELTSFKKTVDGLLEKGEKAEAMRLLQTRAAEYAGANVAGAFTQKMSELSKAERAIGASSRTPEEKRRMLDNIRQYKIATAKAYREAYGKIVKE